MSTEQDWSLFSTQSVLNVTDTFLLRTSGGLGVQVSGQVIYDLVDAKLNLLSWKTKVRAATTANGTLASAYANGSAIDGVTLVTGDRILIKNQTTTTENGIYVVAASGAPTRATDADTGTELVNASVVVSEGTTLADTLWTCTTNAPIVVGTTGLTFGPPPSSGVGTVTSVAMSVPAIFSISGSPVTSNGTLALSLATQTPNTVWCGPSSGGAAAPAFRSLVTADLPKPSTATPSASFTAADTDHNSHKVASGASQTLTLGNISTGVSFTGRFTTAWSIACAGGLSKSGVSPTGITTGSIAAASLITFFHEGGGVWVATGSGLT